MRTLGRIALGIVLIFAVLIAVVLVRTFTFKAPGGVDTASVKVAPAIAVDVDAAARHLSQAVQIQTVSHQDPAENQPAEWTRLHDFLSQTYPAAHAAMTREIVASNTLVYTWKGSDPALAPIVLMAHQDVVPVTPGTEGEWKHPPFAGEIADGAVWGPRRDRRQGLTDHPLRRRRGSGEARLQAEAHRRRRLRRGRGGPRRGRASSRRAPAVARDQGAVRGR